MQKLRLALLTLLVSISGTAGLSLATVNAAALPLSVVGSSQSEACDGLSQLDSTQSCGGSGQTTVTNVVKVILNILSIVLGIVGVIMVVVAGFKYITSGGDPGGVSSAKSTLIYALVGLAVAALSQFLVQFVINSARKAG